MSNITTILNQMKQQLTMNDTYDSELITNIENLPNELFYEIFDYLYDDAYETFSNLNIRFQQLLISYPCLTFNLSSNYESDLEQRYKHSIIPNKHKIVSLRLSNMLIFQQFWNLVIIDSSFIRLESFSLQGIKSDKLMNILNDLHLLPCLFSLSIYLDDHIEDLNNVYQLILSLPQLKYNKLSSRLKIKSISLPYIDNNQQFSSIKHLIINHDCNVNQLSAILSYTPQISHINCRNLLRSNINIEKDEQILLPYLKHFSIGKCYLMFNEFEIFIKKISSQLKILKIIIASNNPTYLDANQWKELISQHLIYLQEFYFEYHQRILSSSHHILLSQFTTSFWIERQWIFELEIDMGENHNTEIIYSIHPYKYTLEEQRKNIFSCKQDSINTVQQENENSSTEIFSPVQLSINYTSNINQSNSTFFNNIRSILTTVHITHLNVNFSMVSIDIFLKIIKFLSKLNTLTISSWSKSKDISLSDEGKQIVSSLSNTNKILQVNLWQTTDFKQIQFIINLCPHIEYIEIDCINYNDIYSLVQFIFDQKSLYIKYLSSLCLYVSKLNDEIIQNLKTTIDLMKLIDNYTIKHIHDKIYLQWK